MKLPPDLRQKEEKRNMEEEEEMKIIHRVKFGAFSSVTLFWLLLLLLGYEFLFYVYWEYYFLKILFFLS